MHFNWSLYYYRLFKCMTIYYSAFLRDVELIAVVHKLLIKFDELKLLLLQTVVGCKTCSCEESSTNPMACVQCTCPDGHIKTLEECNICACVKHAEPPIFCPSIICGKNCSAVRDPNKSTCSYTCKC